MLVVMAIIVILATVVLAVVMKGLKKAEEVEEVSDTRQENIQTLIENPRYDELPQHLQEGRFGEKE